MLQINLTPISFKKRTKKKSPTTPPKLNFTSYDISLIPNITPTRRTKKKRPRSKSSSSQTTLSKSIVAALTEIYHRYTSGDTSRRLALNSITTQSQSSYSTHNSSIGANTFYIEADGELQAAAWIYIRNLYNETQMNEMSLNDFISHYTDLAQDERNHHEIFKALEIHGYYIDNKNHSYSSTKSSTTTSATTSIQTLSFLLNLSDRSLGMRAFAHLSQHVADSHNCSISMLNLSKNTCPDVVGSILLSSLSLNTSVKELNLSYNQLGSESMRSLMEMAGVSSSQLCTLNLIGCHLGKSMHAVTLLSKMIQFNSSIVNLDLSDNQLTNLHIVTLASALRGERSNNNNNNNNTKEEHHVRDQYRGVLPQKIAKSNASNVHHSKDFNKKGVKYLRLCKNRIGHYGISALGSACSTSTSTITSLNISDNPLGATGASFLSECLKETTTLHTLIVERCQLGIRLSEGDGDNKKGRNNSSNNGSNSSNNNYKNNNNSYNGALSSRKSENKKMNQSEFGEKRLFSSDASGLLDLIHALSYTTSMTSINIADNWCGNDIENCNKAAKSLSKMLPKTQLTHINISGVGLGSHGICSIANALYKASGQHLIQLLHSDHRKELKVIQQQHVVNDTNILNVQQRLADVRAYVLKRKSTLSMQNNAMENKSRSMVRDLQTKALRKSPVKEARQAKAAADKIQYFNRTSIRSRDLANELDRLDQLHIAPDRALERLEYRRKILVRNRNDAVVKWQQKDAAAKLNHLSCKLISLDVSWNVLKNEDSKKIQNMSLCLEKALAYLPSLTALRASGNQIPLVGTNGMKALGRGCEKGTIQTLHTHDVNKHTSIFQEEEETNFHQTSPTNKKSSPLSVPNILMNQYRIGHGRSAIDAIESISDSLLLQPIATKTTRPNAIALQQQQTTSPHKTTPTTVVLSSKTKTPERIPSTMTSSSMHNNLPSAYHGLPIPSLTSNPLLIINASNSQLSCSDAVAMAEGIQTSKHRFTVLEINISNNRIWHTTHSKTLGNPSGYVSMIQLAGYCVVLERLLLRNNVVESAVDSNRIRSVISTEIGVKPHSLTREIWKVPMTVVNVLDVRGCNLFIHTGSLREVLENVERCQEMKYFFQCLSTVYSKQMHGDNTKMPLQWENRSPSDVALQILKKHGLEKNWMKNKKNVFNLLKKWDVGDDIVLHGDI